MGHLQRTQLADGIVTEFLPPKKPSQKVMIICDGLPSLPGRKGKVMRYWSKRGYWVFNPRYRGVWESRGRFLAQSPEQDVWDLIKALPQGFVSAWDGERYVIDPEQVVVMGSSFGGTAAIMASRCDCVDKAIAFAPVIDWSAKGTSEPMDWLEKVVVDGYGDGLRFAHEDWMRLSRGEFYQPKAEVGTLDPSKLFVIYALDDEVVPSDSVQAFLERLPCLSEERKKGGHLSASLSMGWRLSRKLRRFLTS